MHNGSESRKNTKFQMGQNTIMQVEYVTRLCTQAPKPLRVHCRPMRWRAYRRI